jgi:SAM-dependent methyltransferase
VSSWQPEQYERQLEQGLVLSGEGADYFARERVRHVAQYCLLHRVEVQRAIELGCGTGNNLPFLARAFAQASLVGLDSSAPMLAAARARMQGAAIEIADSASYPAGRAADLVFVNGVFHHVPRPQRSAVLQQIHGLLRPGGLLALFDNNPLNPGAMWVMKRIEFDRDAQPVLARTLVKLAHEVGFAEIEQRTHFYFPRSLSALRIFEPWLERAPLGAQYVVYARAGR